MTIDRLNRLPTIETPQDSSQAWYSLWSNAC